MKRLPVSLYTKVILQNIRMGKEALKGKQMKGGLTFIKQIFKECEDTFRESKRKLSKSYKSFIV